MLHDEYTHTVPGQRWPNHEWLSQIVFYGVHSLGGMALLTFLCAVAVTVAWAIVASLTVGDPLLRVALLGGGVIMSAGGWTLRPQVLTMTLFATTLWILVRRRGVWLLPLLFLVWANLHGAVALGGVLMIAAALAAMITHDRFLRTLLFVGTGCLVATALTPLGFSLWLEIPFSLQRLQAYGVEEWRAPGLTNPLDIGFWITGIAALTLMIIKRRSIASPSVSMLAMSMCLLFMMAARSGRHVGPFVLCAVPAMSTMFQARTAQRPRSESSRLIVANAVVMAITLAGAVAYVAYAWHASLPRLRWHPLSANLIAAISDCEGQLYNRYDEGGFVIWFVQDRKVFMDSRQDPFPEQLVLDQIRLEVSGDYRAMFDRHRIECALTPQASLLASRLRQDGWHERSDEAAWSVFSARALGWSRR